VTVADSAQLLEQSRTGRDQARAQALAATHTWVQAVMGSVRALATAAGVHGPDRVVVFYGKSVTVPDTAGQACPGCGEPCGEIRDTLTSAVIAGPSGQVRLAAGEGPADAWAEAVDAWDDLRAALSRSYLLEIPVGLLVDVDEQVVACWDEQYCPEIGPEPELVLDVSTPAEDADPRDSFEKLLSAAADEQAAEANAAAWDSRLDRLVDAYALTLPTEPHPAGECDFGEQD